MTCECGRTYREVYPGLLLCPSCEAFEIDEVTGDE